MNEKEVRLIIRLSETFPKIDDENKSYILGIAEGMAIARDSQRDKQLQEA